jgi:hypothetical protein
VCFKTKCIHNDLEIKLKTQTLKNIISVQNTFTSHSGVACETGNDISSSSATSIRFCVLSCFQLN